MTIIEALISDCFPYTVPNGLLEKCLIDADLEAVADYENSLEKPIAIASVQALSKLLSLASENEGGFSQSYNVEALQKRIESICNKHGIDASVYVKQPTINRLDVW